MAENSMVMIIDGITGEVIQREATDLEIKDLEKATQESLDYHQAFEAKKAARESALAKLAALGLTEEEIAAL
jgi:DNA-binding NarL/FixJ family response regulator